MIKINSVVKLKNGKTGKVVGKLENGEYMLASGKGGAISYFKKEDVEKEAF